MATNILLGPPGAGQRIINPAGPAAKLEFAFDQNDALLSKDGQNLVVTFHDGGELILQGFVESVP
ncbi:MAG: hypothetical protein FWG59_00515 [Betaproteobacteria bacterium]|nr:hypothetical protein [Betaproteobacteria bacterium]